MNTYRYTGCMTDGTEVVRLVIARDGDEARRLGRQSCEVDGRHVLAFVCEVAATLPAGGNHERTP